MVVDVASTENLGHRRVDADYPENDRHLENEFCPSRSTRLDPIAYIVAPVRRSKRLIALRCNCWRESPFTLVESSSLTPAVPACPPALVSGTAGLQSAKVGKFIAQNPDHRSGGGVQWPDAFPSDVMSTCADPTFVRPHLAIQDARHKRRHLLRCQKANVRRVGPVAWLLQALR